MRRKSIAFLEKPLTNSPVAVIIQKLSPQSRAEFGGIAQLGERLNGIQEVSGSIPLISTKSLDFFGIQGFFLLLWLVKCDFLRFSPRGKC